MAKKARRYEVPTVGEALGLTPKGEELVVVIQKHLQPFIEEQERAGTDMASLFWILKRYADILECDASNLKAYPTFRTLAYKRKDW